MDRNRLKKESYDFVLLFKFTWKFRKLKLVYRMELYWIFTSNSYLKPAGKVAGKLSWKFTQIQYTWNEGCGSSFPNIRVKLEEFSGPITFLITKRYFWVVYFFVNNKDTIIQ